MKTSTTLQNNKLVKSIAYFFQSPTGSIVGRALVALLWLLLWQLIAVVVGKEILVPKPLAVLRRAWELMGDGEFWLDSGSTLLRVVLGFVEAALAGVVLSVLMYRYRALNAFLDPMLTVIKATPVTSFIILALVWIKGAVMPVFIAFLIVLPIVCANITEGIRQTDRNLLEMAEIYNIRGMKRVRCIYIPSVRPYAASAAKTGIGMAWKACVAAEVIGRTAHSIGDRLYESKLYLETVELFAWTLVVIILSRVIERIIVLFTDGRKNTGKGAAADDKA